MKQDLNFNLEKAHSMEAPGNELCYSIPVEIPDGRFKGLSNINIISKGRDVDTATVDLIRQTWSNIEELLMDAVSYLKDELGANRAKYNVLPKELTFFDLPASDFPVFEPYFTFYSESKEWLIRFSEGKLNICDPAGVVVEFRGNVPISVQDISGEDSLDLDEEIVPG